MKITYGSRIVNIPTFNPYSIGIFQFHRLGEKSRRRYEAAYEAGARAALKAIESGKGARLESALFSAPCDGPEGVGMD